MNKQTKTKHPYAKVYVIVAVALALLAVVAWGVLSVWLQSTGGKDASVGMMLAVPTLVLFWIVGVLGIVNLIAVPVFLRKKFFDRKYSVLALIALVISLPIMIYDAWRVYEILSIRNYYVSASTQQSLEQRYIGLSEQAALDKAKSENRPARVVEREGKKLIITMNLVHDRLDFYIKDGKVYRVDLEG